MPYVDLMKNYPRARRDVEGRGLSKTDEDRQIARKFDRDFFDGDRRHGYGGLNYDSRYWSQVVLDMFNHFQLGPESSVLDVGCAKGFMLKDIRSAFPESTVAGVDISEYAIRNGHPDVQNFLQVADARELPFADDHFDLVVSINTVHNFDQTDCAVALQEITRVSRGAAYVVVDAFSTREEESRILDWNLTARTILSTGDWEEFFETVGYRGGYSWFMP